MREKLCGRMGRVSWRGWMNLMVEKRRRKGRGRRQWSVGVFSVCVWMWTSNDIFFATVRVRAWVCYIKVATV